MGWQATAAVVFIFYCMTFGFGVYNLCQGDWVTIADTDNHIGLFKGCLFDECAKHYEYKWAKAFMVSSVIFAFFGLGAFLAAAASIAKKKDARKIAIACAGCFFVAAMFNIIGQSIWTGQVCNGKCSNYWWNWSYYTGWIATFFLFCCAVGGFMFGRVSND